MPRIFVCEYVTGGGLAGEALPVALAAAGDAMLRALLEDLRAIPAVKTATTRDARLPSLDPDAGHFVCGIGLGALGAMYRGCRCRMADRTRDRGCVRAFEPLRAR